MKKVKSLNDVLKKITKHYLISEFKKIDKWMLKDFNEIQKEQLKKEIKSNEKST